MRFISIFGFLWVASFTGAWAGQVTVRAYQNDSCKSLLDNAIKAIRQDKEPLLPDKAQCPIEAKAVSWLWFRNKEGDFQERVNFLKENPDWPEQRKICIQAELSITADTPLPQLITYFKQFPPLTSEGAMAYAQAARILDKITQETLIKSLWHKTDFNKSDEKEFYSTYKKLLTKEDHGARLDRLMYEGNYYGLERMKPRVSKRANQAIDFVLRILKKKIPSKRQYNNLPAYYQSNPALLSCLIKGKLGQKQEEEALNYFQKAVKSRLFEEAPSVLRRYRNYFGRSLFKKGDPKAAYSILTQSPIKEEQECLQEYVEGEWFAAWLALKELHQPKQALQRFLKLYALVKTAISQAKMAYWLGETQEALGNEADAQEWFTKATAFPHTYYGQLALKKLGHPIQITFEQAPMLNLEAVHEQELLQVLKILVEYHFEQEADALFLFLAKTLSSSNVKALMTLAKDMQLEHMMVLGTKFASKNGPILLETVYPLRPIPDSLEKLPFLSKPLILSLIRQESGFNEKIVSYAAAKGLMQLQNPTAKQVAKKHTIEFQDHYLTHRPDINMQLGCHHLSDLLQRYDGNIILTLAAYNAGPTPVHEWIKILGDPRDPGTNLTDWVESIPFEQTRTYIQRILETIPIYKKRLG